MTDAPVLEVDDVAKTYDVSAPLLQRLFRQQQRTLLTALDGVDLELRRGEILALVGESGSGKSTLANILVGSLPATRGQVVQDGSAIPARRDKELSRRIQMVFQDPYSSLNPRLTVRAMLSELLRVHDIVPRSEVRKECLRLVSLVGLDEDALDAYPGQFSGGQRQRIAIARALAVRPDVLIADEPVSALDVSVQATILELFASLRDELGLTILFIAHNLAVVQHLCQRVAVMYLGRIVEVAGTDEIFANPRHPYTRALIASIPRMGDTSGAADLVPEGEPPSPYDLPTGCRYHPRCPFAEAQCRELDPSLRPLSESAGRVHLSACLRASDLPESP
ncbi:ABC transporter ATP-binding protein [Flexivirga endophytica]|uniref:ABC transporter ATP-binding protein n=1 Tax=Flexivirga endophytica TaxID=1849103 RepID=A0A916WSC1_9MICO|nr:oligopeptide/dipeptide ABC transporter ATP-binding protein [Flexivirga endophytica]GGB26043.1 ABC transporter ATP-binding protein [Flexivirga endophytica]GHB54592.1 ABC transporter ATP-binding protein [Flexivirga endophytica]